MIVAVGGHTRNIGKTSVAAGLIRATPEFGWTAVKITQFGHGLCSRDGHACACETGCDHPYTLVAETAPSASDSGRFLAAGAVRSFWLRTRAGGLGGAVAELERLIAGSRNVMLESNSVVDWIRPDVYLFVADGARQDWKASARRLVARADAIVLTGAACAELPAGVPVFPAPDYSSDALVAWLRARANSMPDQVASSEQIL